MHSFCFDYSLGKKAKQNDLFKGLPSGSVSESAITSLREAAAAAAISARAVDAVEANLIKDNKFMRSNSVKQKPLNQHKTFFSTLYFLETF